METTTMYSETVDSNSIDLATMETVTKDFAIWISQKWAPHK